MRETIPSFGIQPPFLGAKNPLGLTQNYLGKSSQSLLIINKYLNRSKLKFPPLLDSRLSSEIIQRSLFWDTEFDNSEFSFSEYSQVNESDNRVARTLAEFQELSPTNVYVVEEHPLDFTASDTPIQTSTERKNTRKTTKAKSKTKTPTRKTTSKKTGRDVVKQAHPSIDSNPQRKKRRRAKTDVLLEEQGLGENDVTRGGETINSTSEQNLHIYSSEDLPFQSTALEQSITPVEKEIQSVAPAQPANTDSSPATITTPIQLASIPESHQQSTLDAVSTTEEIVSSSTQKQSARQLATAEQIIDQTIASNDRAFEPQENLPSQPTGWEISVKSKAAQLQQSTVQKTGITLNQDVETTATEAIPPNSPLSYSSPHLEKRLHLPLEQRLKQVEKEESPVAEIESNIISNQQLTESNIVTGNLTVTNSSTVEPSDRPNQPQDYSPSQTRQLDKKATPENISSLQPPGSQPPTKPKLFTIPAARREIQPTSTIPVVPDTTDQPFLDTAVDSQQLPSVSNAAPEQIIASSGSNQPQDYSPSQTRQLDKKATPENVSSLQPPGSQPPVALDVLTTASGAKQIYPASIDEIDEEESSVTKIKSNTISNQQLTESDIILSLEVTSSSTFESRDRDCEFPQESAEVPSIVEPPDRHVSAPDLPVKQSRFLQPQEQLLAEFPSLAAHPTPQTEQADSIASANSQQPPIQETLLERIISDRETPSSQPEPGNEARATSSQQSVTRAETQSVFPSLFPPQGFAVGGAVPASSNLSSKPIAASDTVPAMLTPGEFVVNATDAQKHLDVLHHINKGGAVEILPETPTKVESSDAAKDPLAAPNSVQRKISHTSLPRVVKTLIPPTLQLAEEPAAKNQVTQPDTPQTHYAATRLIFRKPAPTSSASPNSIPARWDSVEDLLFGGTASDNSYTSDSMAVPTSYFNRNATPSNPGTSEMIVSSVQPQGFAKGGEVAPDTFTPEKAIAHTIEAPASCCQNKADSNDLEMLAREVYHRLRQRLELERERHGFYSGRLPW